MILWEPMASTTTIAQQLPEMTILIQRVKASEEKLARIHGNTITDSKDIEHAHSYGAAITAVQTRLDLDTTIDNLAMDKQQVMIAANNSFVNTTMEESLHEITREASQNSFAAPPVTPCVLHHVKFH
jgi:hypothetical protein